eukprot:COSAG02_NODE_29894_length_561_cov_0.595238_1_plen_28_part_10
MFVRQLVEEFGDLAFLEFVRRRAAGQNA